MGRTQSPYFYILKGVLLITMAAWLHQGSTASLCLRGSFDSQVRYLLSNQLLPRSAIRNLSTVFSDLEETLQELWPGSEVIPVGSFKTGMMMKTSDIDCMINVPRYTIYNETANRYLIVEAVRLLRKYPELYADVTSKFRLENEVSLLVFIYVSAGKKCDCNFISTKAYKISKMISDFYSLDRRVWRVAAILKFWFNVHQSKRLAILDTYTLNLLIIFYFQQNNILPPFYLLPSVLHKKKLDKDFNNKLISVHQSPDVYQLLGGFFEYYSKFNYKEHVVSVSLGRAIHKTEFEDIKSLPDELSEYKSYMSKSNSKPMVLNTTLCVQDVFSQHLNVLERSVSGHILIFISRVKFATARFQRLPRDRFLTAILVKDKYYHKTFELSDTDEVKSLEECLSNKTKSSVFS